jgi:YD repeat-containing protein
MNRILTIALFLLASGATASAQNQQNVAKGFQADKTYEVGQLDAISLFNGNLNVTIPIGQTYVVSPTLSYSFRLVYSGNNWNMETIEHEWWRRNPPHDDERQIALRSVYFPGAEPIAPATGPPTPDRVWMNDNAGLGWRLSLGRLSVPFSTTPPTVFGGGTYHSPDGGKHQFWPVLHKAEVETTTLTPLIGYTNDGSYLKLRRIVADNTHEVDFPNGNVHTFDHNGMLTKMRDAFGNQVTFSFQRDAQTNIATWTVIDPYRQHTFKFHDVVVASGGIDPTTFPILKSADLAAFGGVRATYEFNYAGGDQGAAISRRWAGGRRTVADCSTFVPPLVRVPLLAGIVQPDDSTYDFEYDRGDEGATFSDPMGGTEPFTDIPELKNLDGSLRTCYRNAGFSGSLKRVTMPAGGSVDWAYRVWAFPADSSKKALACGQPPPPPPILTPCNTEGGYDAAVGVGTRIERDRDDAILSKRTYTATTDTTPVDWATQITTVTSYAADSTIEQKSLHYYSVDGKDDSAKGRTQGHYGLPYSREDDLDDLTTVANPGPADAVLKGFISTKTYDAADNLLSYTYVRYEGDDAEFEAGDESNRRLQTQINVDVVNDTTTWTTSHSTDFDGLGHYRTTETTGSVDGDAVRRTITNYNPGAKTYPDTFVLPSVWVLNTYDSTKVEEERGAVTDSRVTEFCFDAATGFLNRTRTIRGATAGRTDLLTVFKPERVNNVPTGHVEKESYYGGDEATPGAPDTRLVEDFVTCADAPDTPAFELTHKYAFGVRRESQYSGSSFKTLDLTIDESTGLAEKSRDALASRFSSFDYDTMGRIVELRPPGQAWTKYEYDLANAKAVVQQYAATDTGTNPLTESHAYYDGLGRLVQQKNRVPEGWATVGHTYDWLSRKKSTYVGKAFATSSARSGTTGAAATTFGYDARGRLETTTSPDGSVVVQAYPEARRKTRTVSIATEDHPEGEEATTAETYDVFGRLASVEEPSGTGGAEETTSYAYDVGNSLREVVSGAQTRTFVRDGAGLLVEEDHPETAETAYLYDARGHVTKQCIGGCTNPAVELEYTYDFAERLKTVFDRKASETLKSLTYDLTDPGRLATQARHNHFSNETYTVKDTFTYEANTGRPAKKVTDITIAPPDAARPPLKFTHDYDYTDLGAPDHIKYPTCASCGNVASSPRDIPLRYQYGHLTGITGVTTTLEAPAGLPAGTDITYTPAGAVERVQHAKANGQRGVTDVFERDPDGIARVAAIRFEQAQDCAIIESGPDDQTVTSGDDVTLTVTVPAGATVAWFQGATGDTSTPAGSGVSLLLENVVEEAFYWCSVKWTAGGCEDRSRMATITVEIDPCATQSVSIEAVPSQVAEGQPFQLRSSNGPAGTSYTWRRGAETLATTTAAAYDVIAGIAEATHYSVSMQTAECTVTSSELVMTPCLMKRTVHVVAANGGTTATLSVVADQAGVTYQWYEGTSHQDLSKPRGTGPIVSVPITGATQFWVRMTRICSGVTVTLDSDVEPVDFSCLPTIFIHPLPASRSTQQGTVSATVTAGGQGPFDVEWVELLSDGADRVLVSRREIPGNGAESTYTWTYTSGDAYSRLVYAKIWQGTQGPEPSDAVTLSVSPTPQTIDSSSPELTVLQPTQWTTLFVTMNPPAGPAHEYTYEWFADDGTRDGESLGHTMSSMAVSGATTSYWVVVKGVHNRNTAQEHRQVTISPRMVVRRSTACELTPLRIEQSLHKVCNVTSLTASPLVTFRAYVDSGDVAYQWYVGQTGDTRVPLEATPGKPYECQVLGNTVQKLWLRVTHECGATVDSPTLSFEHGNCAPLFIDQHLEPVEAGWGDDALVVFEPLAGTSTQYLWYEEGQSGGSDSWLSEATGATLHLQNVTKSARYWVHVRDGNCPNSGTNTFPTLVRVGSAQGMTPPAWVTEVWRDSDSTTGTALSAQTAGGVRYQWFQGPILDQSHPVADSSNSTYTTPNLTADTQYWVRVHGSGGNFLDSPTITVKVCNPPQLTAQQQSSLSLNREINAGQQAVFNVPITEPAAGSRFTYQWFRVDGSTLQPLAVYSTSLVVNPQSTTRYKFRASTTCATERFYESPVFTATVCTQPVITTPAAALPTRIFPGSSSTLSVAATVTPAGPLTYQWYAGASGSTGSPVAGGTAASITVSPTADTTYWVRVTRGACSVDSAAVTVSICSYPQSVTLPAAVNIEHGQTATLQFPSVSPVNQSKFIRWYKGVTGDTSTLVQYVASAFSLNHTTTALTATTQYWLEFEHLGCVTRSNTVIVNVCKPTITGQPSGTTIASGATASLSVTTSPIPGKTFQWYTGAPGNTANPVANGTTASINVTPATTTSYWVRVKGTCVPDATVDSAAATITVCTPPAISTVSATQYVGPGTQTAVTVNAAGSNLTYQWYLGTSGTTTNPIYNATSAMHYVTPASTTSYWCRVTSENFCSANGPTMTVNVCAPPTITQQPSALPTRVFPGATATLSVTASGSVTYQWYAGTPGNTATPIAGATTASITVSPTADTSYWVRVKTSVCTTDSAGVTVTICTYPQVATLPASVNIAYDQSTTLQFPLLNPLNEHKFIRWYKGPAGNTSTLVHFAASAPSLNYATPALTATTQYWLEYEHLGCVTRSNATTVYVCKPTITSQPTGTTVANGTPVTLSVGTTPIPGQTFQWYAGPAGNTSAPVANGTGASLLVTPGATTSYWVRVKGTCTPEAAVDSAAATIVVCNPPAISSVSSTHYIRSGIQTAVSITATGSNLTYQWYLGASGTTTSPINNATSSLLYVTPTTTTSYWCRVTSEGLCPANGPTMTVNVCNPPTITQQPSAMPVRIFAGATSTLSVTASGSVTYQWYVGTPGTTTSPIAGATTASINVSPTADTTYWVRVTTSVCTTDSAAVTVLICDYPQSVTLPANVNIAYGQTATLQFPTISPLNQSKYIRWYKGLAGDTATLVHYAASATSLNYTTPALTATTKYWLEFEHLGCITRSNTVTVNVCQPTITSQPTGTTVANGTPVTLSVGTTAIAGQTYQWYTGAVGNTSAPVPSGTTASISVTPGTTTSYWVRVKGTCVPEAAVDSAAATITVCNPPAITSVSPTHSIRSGIQTVVTVNATGSNLTYQWYVGTSGTTTSPINNATASMHYVTPTVTTSYWCRVTSENLCSVNSATMTVNVCNPPTITQQPVATPSRLFPGGSSTLSVTASGSVTYQWYVGTTGQTTSPIAGATTASIAVSPAAATTYWVRVTTSVCTTDSASVTVSQCTYAPTITLPATYDVVSGGSVTVPFPLMTPLNELKDIRWYRGPAGVRTNLVRSATSVSSLSHATGPLTQDTQYWVEFDHNGCTTTSTATTVRVCRPTITAQPQSVTILSGSSTTLAVGTTGAPLTYQWYIGDSGVTTQPVGGQTSASLTVAPTANTTYWVRVSGCGGMSADSVAATVTVCTGPTITSILASGSFHIGTTASVSVTATGESLSYQWYKGQSGDTSQPIPSGVTDTYMFTTQTSQYYWVRVTSACNNVSVNSSAVLYSVQPTITTHPADVTIPRGTSATLTVAATGTYLSYQWYQGNSGTIIPGATSPTYTTPPLTTGTPEYFCIVKSGTAGKNSLHAFVTLCDGPTIQSFTTIYSAPPTYGLKVTVPSSQTSLVEYHWYSGTPGNTAQSTYLGEGSHTRYFGVTTPTTYWVRVAFISNPCSSDSAGKTLP